MKKPISELEQLCQKLIAKLEQVEKLPEKQQKDALRELEALAGKHITWNEWLEGREAA